MRFLTFRYPIYTLRDISLPAKRQVCARFPVPPTQPTAPSDVARNHVRIRDCEHGNGERVWAVAGVALHRPSTASSPPRANATAIAIGPFTVRPRSPLTIINRRVDLMREI